ncbi:MAG: hypothetical protein HZC41_12825 [Chloroflexi bacterium]|nr:hypothetical protein [Chloroflexota bacterium]
MSKRKNRSTSPNLPQEALERARRQIAEERGELPPEPVVEEKPKAVAPPKPATPYRPVTETRSTRLTPTTVSAGRISRRRANEPGQGKRRDEAEQYDMQTVRYLLQHPTKTVTVEELRQQYGYVIHDLRQIALLSAGLILTLIVISLVLPK